MQSNWMGIVYVAISSKRTTKQFWAWIDCEHTPQKKTTFFVWGTTKCKVLWVVFYRSDHGRFSEYALCCHMAAPYFPQWDLWTQKKHLQIRCCRMATLSRFWLGNVSPFLNVTSLRFSLESSFMNALLSCDFILDSSPRQLSLHLELKRLWL